MIEENPNGATREWRKRMGFDPYSGSPIIPPYERKVTVNNWPADHNAKMISIPKHYVPDMQYGPTAVFDWIDFPESDILAPPVQPDEDISNETALRIALGIGISDRKRVNTATDYVWQANKLAQQHNISLETAMKYLQQGYFSVPATHIRFQTLVEIISIATLALFIGGFIGSVLF